MEVNSICRFVVTKVGATFGSHKGLEQFQYLFLAVWVKILSIDNQLVMKVMFVL